MSESSKDKKLVLVSAISALVIGASKKVPKMILDLISYIYYTVQFRKDKEMATIQALINSNIEVNAITPAYAKQLGFQTWKTDIGAQKIDGLSLATYGIVIAAFQIKD